MPICLAVTTASMQVKLKSAVTAFHWLVRERRSASILFKAFAFDSAYKHLQ